MTWSRAGTVSVTQNSNEVIGTGTAFIGDSRVGDAFIGPDGALYEVTNIASNTALAIAPAYNGASFAAGLYALAPMQGYNKATADALRAASLQVGDALDGLEESVAQAAASAATATAVKVDVLANAAVASTAASAAGNSESHVATLAAGVEEDAASSTSSAAAALASKEAAAMSEANAAASAGAVANALIKTGGTMSGALNDAPPAPLASAATVDIGGAASNIVMISGTVAISALGTIAAGARRTVRFLGALVLTHNATSLILPTGASITTAANDTAEFLSLGEGSWFCLDYTRSSGKALAKDFAYDRSNIVGTVSDSGGLPNGAAFESGIINGTRYLKLADGALFQYKTVLIGGGTVGNGNVFKSLTYDMGALAVSPVGDWVVTAYGISQASGGGWAGQQAFGAAGQWGQWSAYTSTAVSGSVTISLMGIGRWKS